MTFPEEATVIQPEEVSKYDIIIEDRKLVALGGNELATQVSNTAAEASFYSKLIESLASSIRSKEKSGKTKWDLNSYHLATERIINLVIKAKSPVQKRFIWFRQFPNPHYVVMTREQTVNKLSNDLDCQLRKLRARESTEAVQHKQILNQKQKRAQRRYGRLLILKICKAVQRGVYPYEAALLLDKSYVQSQMSPQVTDEANVTPPADDCPEQYQESALERSIRLLLRHRFLACVRSKKCIFELANALLTMWGLPNVVKHVPRMRKKKKSISNSGLQDIGVTDPSKVDGGCDKNLGLWRRDERAAFLTGLERYGYGQWKDIVPYVPTR
jgi:hypothetical protein